MYAGQQLSLLLKVVEVKWGINKRIIERSCDFLCRSVRFMESDQLGFKSIKMLVSKLHADDNQFEDFQKCY